MFGYVVVNKPELKIREYDTYKEYYCGLCHALKKYHGAKCQMCLAYDYVFLLLLFSGLYEPDETKKAAKCAIHPLKKQILRDNKFMEYVADMGVVLASLKCADDWTDEKKLAQRTYGSLIKKEYEKVKEKYPEKVEIIEQSLMNIAKAEAMGEENVDVISGYFGKAFEEVCAVYCDEWEISLRKVGFYLGKFIYVMDAYDDLEKDIKKGQFNPFKKKKDEVGFDDYVCQILTINAAECAREFEKLPILNDVEILRNILYSGIWSRFNAVSEGRASCEKSL